MRGIGSGWRLCTAAEWLDACNGGGNTTFPYGNTYTAQRCNGWDFTKAAGVTTLATGAATMCVSEQSTTTSGDELYDMSGNVKEWVLTTATTTRTVRDARRRLQHGQLHGRHDDQRARPAV